MSHQNTAITGPKFKHALHKQTGTLLLLGILSFWGLFSCGFPIIPQDYLMEEAEILQHMTLIKEVRFENLGGTNKSWLRGIEAGPWPIFFPQPESPKTDAYLIFYSEEDPYELREVFMEAYESGTYVFSLRMDEDLQRVDYPAISFSDPDLRYAFIQSPPYNSKKEFLRYFPVSSSSFTRLGIIGPVPYWEMLWGVETISLRTISPMAPLDPQYVPGANDVFSETRSVPVPIQPLNYLVRSLDATLNAAQSTTFGAYPTAPRTLSDGKAVYDELALVLFANDDTYTARLKLPDDDIDPYVLNDLRNHGVTPLGSETTGGFFAADIVNDTWHTSTLDLGTQKYISYSWRGLADTYEAAEAAPIVRVLGDGTALRMKDDRWQTAPIDSGYLPQEGSAATWNTGGLTFLYEYYDGGDWHLMFNQALTLTSPLSKTLVLRAWSIPREDFLALVE